MCARVCVYARDAHSQRMYERDTQTDRKTESARAHEREKKRQQGKGESGYETAREGREWVPLERKRRGHCTAHHTPHDTNPRAVARHRKQRRAQGIPVLSAMRASAAVFRGLGFRV
jgi:hypothetical protein